MDRRRMDAADGGRVWHRVKPVRKLAVVVAVQNFLVVACLMVTLYVYWDVQSRAPTEGVHIHFDATPDITDNVTLQIGLIHSSNMMRVVGEKDETIRINCTGPYVLYMDICYKSLSKKELKAVVQLRVGGSITPVSSFTLNTSGEDCRGLHQIAYLRAKEDVSLHLYSAVGFKVKNVTVGLSYLLGSRCEF